MSRAENRLKQSLKRYTGFLKETYRNHAATRSALIEVRDSYEALQAWDKALEVEENILSYFCDGEIINRANTLFRMGKLHLRLNDIDAATEAYREALSLYRMKVGSNISEEFACKIMTVADLEYQRGRPDESIELLLEAYTHLSGLWSKKKKKSEKLTTSLFKCLQQLGLLYQSRQDFHSALKAYKGARTMLELLGDGHRYQSKMQGLQLDIADMLAAVNQRDAAMKMYEEIFDGEVGEAADNDNRSKKSAASGRNSSRRTPWSASATRRKEPPGEKINMDVDDALFDMRKRQVLMEAQTFASAATFDSEQQAYYQRSLEYLTRALESKERKLGHNHPSLAKLWNALGAVHASANNQNAAFECFQQVSVLSGEYTNIRGIESEPDDDPHVSHALRHAATMNEENLKSFSYMEATPSYSRSFVS